MKICVCVKQVPDTIASIKLQEDKSRIDTSDIQWIISPYDELALKKPYKYVTSIQIAW